MTQKNMAKKFEINEDLYIGNTNTTLKSVDNSLTTLNNTLPKKWEWGVITGNQMTKYNFGSGQSMYKTITFKNTYNKIPTIIVGNCSATSGKGYWGIIPSAARSITNKGFDLVVYFDSNSELLYASYLVLSND